MICISQSDDPYVNEFKLNGKSVDEIYPDLTGRQGDSGVNITNAKSLHQNANIAFMGDIKGGSFNICGDLARKWLLLPTNPNGRPNSDVLKPWINGLDITRRSSDQWIVDFGFDMTKSEAALYESPFQHILEHVKPEWEQQREKNRRNHWWLHHNPRPKMWHALSEYKRYIATPCTSKHRLFVWFDIDVCPSNALIAFARDDDTTFGILHSRFHKIWSLRTGSSLEDRPRYTHTTTFNTFPFPERLSPNVPANDYQDDPHARAIASAARHLVELRNRWMNPPEYVMWINEPVAGYPLRVVPKNQDVAKELKKRTLTNLYNRQPQWLIDAHAQLDEAVANAYGWSNQINDDQVLRNLLSLNRNRSKG